MDYNDQFSPGFEDNGSYAEPARYKFRTGKWGQYFHDTKHKIDMPLEAVLSRLHEIDPLKERLAKANEGRPIDDTF